MFREPEDFSGGEEGPITIFAISGSDEPKGMYEIPSRTIAVVVWDHVSMDLQCIAKVSGIIQWLVMWDGTNMKSRPTRDKLVVTAGMQITLHIGRTDGK